MLFYVCGRLHPAFENNLQFTPRGKRTSGLQTAQSVQGKLIYIYDLKSLYNQFVLSDQAAQSVLVEMLIETEDVA